MMDDIKRCIRVLRGIPANKLHVSPTYMYRHMVEAADLLESFTAELEQVKQERDGLNILLGQAQSMLEARTRERDAALMDIERAESAAEDMRHLLDTDVHPNCDYGLYMSLYDALSDIVAWNHNVRCCTKEN